MYIKKVGTLISAGANQLGLRIRLGFGFVNFMIYTISSVTCSNKFQVNSFPKCPSDRHYSKENQSNKFCFWFLSASLRLN